jgi:hypothetical protein
LTASSKVNRSSICENREKTENEFVVSSLYMSHRLLVFLDNKLVNVGSGDVELIGLFFRVCCTLGVDYACVILTKVFFTVICVAFVEGTMHWLVHGV